jgi:hypothetical protein
LLALSAPRAVSTRRRGEKESALDAIVESCAHDLTAVVDVFAAFRGRHGAGAVVLACR